MYNRAIKCSTTPSINVKVSHTHTRTQHALLVHKCEHVSLKLVAAVLFNSATVHRHTCVAPTLNTWTRMLFPMVCDNNAQQPSEHPHFASPINLPSSNEARNERDDCGHFYSFPHPRSPINHSCVLSSHSNTRGKTRFKVVPFLLRFYFVPSLSRSLRPCNSNRASLTACLIHNTNSHNCCDPRAIHN